MSGLGPAHVEKSRFNCAARVLLPGQRHLPAAIAMPHAPPTGPITLKGQSGRGKETSRSGDRGTISLRVADAPARGQRSALLHPDDLATLQSGASHALLELSKGSDCVLLVTPDGRVPCGTIWMDIAQRYNFRVLPGDTHEFRHVARRRCFH